MIYKLALPNNLYGHLLPPEDSWLVSGNIFCVADGITRDPVRPKNFFDMSFADALVKYPNPSGARAVADIFCESFVKALNKKTPSQKAVRDAFIFGNKKIDEYNKKHIKKIDYLVNDFFGCCASAGVIYKNILFWGAICDCGIIVYRKNGTIKFESPNWMKPFTDYEKKYLQKSDYDFAKPAYRKTVRTEYRNNPAKIVNDKCVSYGALTGEKTAEAFMHFGEIALSKGDLVVFYSDGFEATVRHDKFFPTIYQKSESLADQLFIPYTLSLARKDDHNFGKERTLIATIV